jgi:hypothetical protein
MFGPGRILQVNISTPGHFGFRHGNFIQGKLEAQANVDIELSRELHLQPHLTY